MIDSEVELLLKFKKEDLEFIEKCMYGEKYLTEKPDMMSVFYDHFRDEMPYGVMKARTGDPDIWILERLEKSLLKVMSMKNNTEESNRGTYSD